MESATLEQNSKNSMKRKIFLSYSLYFHKCNNIGCVFEVSFHARICHQKLLCILSRSESSESGIWYNIEFMVAHHTSRKGESIKVLIIVRKVIHNLKTEIIFTLDNQV